MKRLLLLSIVVICSVNLIGQDSPDDIIAKFWENYKTGDAVKTLDELYKNSPWMSRAADDVAKIKAQFGDLTNLVGEFHGYELLASDEIAGCYMIYIYVAKYDRQPVTIQFDFYKPKDKWIVQGFTYRFSFDDDFEAAVKAKIYKD